MDFSNYFEFLRYGILILKSNISEELLLLKYKIFFIPRKLIRNNIKVMMFLFLIFFKFFIGGKKNIKD